MTKEFIFAVIVPEHIKEWLEMEAKRDKMSINDAIVTILQVNYEISEALKKST